MSMSLTPCSTVVATSGITYMEGYLWDKPPAKEAFRKAATLAHKHGRKVALTLSDSFCVDRHRAEFLDLIKTRDLLEGLNADSRVAEIEVLSLAPIESPGLSKVRVHHAAGSRLLR